MYLSFIDQVRVVKYKNNIIFSIELEFLFVHFRPNENLPEKKARLMKFKEGGGKKPKQENNSNNISTVVLRKYINGNQDKKKKKKNDKLKI
jgi:hypothetical protein